MCEARIRLRTWVEGVACAPAVPQGVLLDAATHLTWGVASELDDMEGVEDAGGVLELIVDGVLAVPGRDPASRSGYRSETVRRALLASSHARCQTCLGPGLTSGPWDAPPLEWSTMPVSSRGPRRRRSWWCHTCSSTPSTRTPAKRAGSSDSACRHGLIWDHTVFHVVPNCRASPKIVAPSKRNCRIAQRIARVPRRARGAHIEWFCSLKVAIWQVVLEGSGFFGPFVLRGLF